MRSEFHKHVCIYAGESSPPMLWETVLQAHNATVVHFSQKQDCLKSICENPCDLLLVDLRRQAADGISLIAKVKQSAPWIASVALVPRGDISSVVAALKAGACNGLDEAVQGDFVRKILEAQLKWAEASATHSYRGLTDTELRVLQLLVKGRTSSEIAGCLGLSKRTIGTHRRKIRQKLSVGSIIELVRQAFAMGFTESHGFDSATVAQDHLTVPRIPGTPYLLG